jgi:tyrosyl-tRNA synthetase
MGEGIDFAKLCYPIMQAADVFNLNANLPHAGLDQRKAHVIAKDVANQLNFKPLLSRKQQKIKPVALHHHLLLGLQKPSRNPANLSREELQNLRLEMKMSKSKPKSCIFVHDSLLDIEKKIIKAFCPAKEILYNPIIDWVENLLLPLNGAIEIKTTAGSKCYRNINKGELLQGYQNELIHPLDLKEAVIKDLQNLLKPIHDKFQKGRSKQLKEELLLINRDTDTRHPYLYNSKIWSKVS